MKVKIICTEDYGESEEQFNEFSETVTVQDVKLFETYCPEKNSGLVTYHVFYTDKREHTEGKSLGVVKPYANARK